MDDGSRSASDDELLSLVQNSDNDFTYFSNFDTANLVTEYTKYGVFKLNDPLEYETDVTKSELYSQFLSTLKNLSDTHTSHEYVRYLFQKDKTHLSTNVNFSRADCFDDSMKHYEVLVHTKPYDMIGKCTLRQVDGPSGVTSVEDFSVKSVYSVVVNSDVLNVIPSLGFKLSKKQNVSSEVFHMNHGSANYVQLSLLRHRDDENDLFPSTFLVEIKCFGNLELDFYKNRINTVSKLLYKFVKF